MTGNSSLFYLPSSCPDVDFPICSSFEPTSSVILEDLEEDSDIHLMDPPPKQPNTPSKRRTAKGKAIVSEDDLRRSLRLKRCTRASRHQLARIKIVWGALSIPQLFHLPLSETWELASVILILKISLMRTCRQLLQTRSL